MSSHLAQWAITLYYGYEYTYWLLSRSIWAVCVTSSFDMNSLSLVLKPWSEELKRAGLLSWLSWLCKPGQRSNGIALQAPYPDCISITLCLHAPCPSSVSPALRQSSLWLFQPGSFCFTKGQNTQAQEGHTPAIQLFVDSLECIRPDGYGGEGAMCVLLRKTKANIGQVG